MAPPGVGLEAAQVIEIGIGEPQLAQVLDGGAQPGGDGEAALERRAAEEEVEDGLPSSTPVFHAAAAMLSW